MFSTWHLKKDRVQFCKIVLCITFLAKIQRISRLFLQSSTRIPLLRTIPINRSLFLLWPVTKMDVRPYPQNLFQTLNNDHHRGMFLMREELLISFLRNDNFEIVAQGYKLFSCTSLPSGQCHRLRLVAIKYSTPTVNAFCRALRRKVAGEKTRKHLYPNQNSIANTISNSLNLYSVDQRGL